MIAPTPKRPFFGHKSARQGIPELHLPKLAGQTGDMQEYSIPSWPAMPGATASQVGRSLATDPFGVPTMNGIKRMTMTSGRFDLQVDVFLTGSRFF